MGLLERVVEEEELTQDLIRRVRRILHTHLVQVEALQHGERYEGELLKPGEVDCVVGIWRGASADKLAKIAERTSPLAHLPDEVIRRLLVKAAPKAIEGVVIDVKPTKSGHGTHKRKASNGNGNGKGPH